MPEQYEAIRDELISKGAPVKDAKAKAARIWNAKNPGDPLSNYVKKEKRRTKTSRKK